MNNPWFVGVGCGILSGLAVTLVTRILLRRRENREYAQKVSAANHDVIYSIRSGIPESIIPSKDIVMALISSSSRKHEVSAKDLFGPGDVLEELIREVMDSSFISANRKAEYCSQLNNALGAQERLGSFIDQRFSGGGLPEISLRTLAEYRERFTTLASVLVGVITSIMMTVFIILLLKREPDYSTSTIFLFMGISGLAILFIVFYSLIVLGKYLMPKRDYGRTDQESVGKNEGEV